MGAVESASRALRALSRHPVIFVAAAAFGLFKVPIEITGYVHLSYLYGLLALFAFPFTPLLLAALYGICDAALKRDRRLERVADGGSAHRTTAEPVTRRASREAQPAGRPGLGDAWKGIKQGYVSLLLANVLYAVVQHILLFTSIVLWLFTAILVLLVAGIALELGAGTLAGDVVLLVGFLVLVAIAAVYVVVRFALAFLVQLYRPAAVVGGKGPVEAFVESVRLVRNNVRSAVGFVLVRAFVFIVLLMPGAVALISFLLVEIAVFEALAEGEAMHILLAMAVLVYCLGVVQLSFLGTYRIAFYRELTDGDVPLAPEASVSREPASSRPGGSDGSISPEFRPSESGTRGGEDTERERPPAWRNRTAHDTAFDRNDNTAFGRGEPDPDSEAEPDSKTGFVFGQPLEPASEFELDSETGFVFDQPLESASGGEGKNEKGPRKSAFEE